MASIIRADALQNINTSNIISQTNATTLTLGYSGQTIAVASGATLLGGGITWTSNVVTSALTVAVNTGYFVNTSSNAITVTLPASASVGNTIILSDFNRTWATNNLTLSTNALNFQGNTSPNPVYSTDGQTVQLVYSGATQGWIPISDDDVTLETPQFYSVDFLVVAGGGGSGAPGATTTSSGGSGAGGLRTSAGPSGGGASAESSLTFDQGITYTITVGAGGAGAPAGSTSSFGNGNNGNNSSISGTGITTITSSGGGAGANGVGPGYSGGSGGGACSYNGGWNNPGAGTANQGYAGANGDNSQNPSSKGGGGGGAGAAGNSFNGGIGVASTITGSSVYYAGGGASTSGTGGNGGGANGVNETSGLPGTVNTGGGGGGGFSNSTQAGGSGGSGVVILRMSTSNYTGTTTGSPTVTTSGSNTILKYTGSGSYTA